jgi:sugar phosphate isomerase/epimerase
MSALGELARRADHRGVRLAIETGPDPGDVLAPLLDSFDTTGLAASIDPAALLASRIDPIATTRSLGAWVVHAYASDATTAAAAGRVVSFSGTGFPPGVLDWEEYLGALEEIAYQGYLTIWPDPARPIAPQWNAITGRLAAY